MPSIEVRPFRRSDREQLTTLVNAHIEVVLPGAAVSVNAVLRQLEREPEETIVDPWAVARTTLVAVARDEVVAAAHLVRYGAGEEVGPTYRDAAEIRWLLFWPGADDAAGALAERCIAEMAAWGVRRMYADGSLPAPGVYGIPDVWPHVGAALERAGFAAGDRVEAVLVADVADLPHGRGPAPVAGMTVRRRWAATPRASRQCSTGASSPSTRSRPTSPAAAHGPGWPAGPTCGSSTSTRGCGAGASGASSWGTRPTGCAWAASTACSTTSSSERPTRTSRSSGRSASRS